MATRNFFLPRHPVILLQNPRSHKKVKDCFVFRQLMTGQKMASFYAKTLIFFCEIGTLPNGKVL
jgi:hypothetical protein